MLFSELRNLTGGKLAQFVEDKPVTTLLIDSRKAVVHEGSVFFAIKGLHHDGHLYLSALYNAGITQFVVESDLDVQDFPKANILRVTSSVEALQAIASYHRSLFSIPVIGITGSNGKTIIKEWLYQLLSHEYSIAKNPGSYNSQVGVPLSVWQLQEHHTLGIFEAGISMPGEMDRLAKIIDPTIGIFTNIGTAHDQHFTNTEQKVNEKLALFKNVITLICCSDHTQIIEMARAKKIPVLSWGMHASADIPVHGSGNHYHVQYKNTSFEIHLPFSDHASVENSFHCIALMLHLGFTATFIQEKIQGLHSVPMRLELKEGINQCHVIDDTYNNDLGGLQISLDFLNNLKQKKNKTLILSDILQSGLPGETLVNQIASMVNRSGLTKFIGIGKTIATHAKLFQVPAQFYQSTEEFLQSFQTDEFHAEIILVKGARVFQFEKIVARLQRKVHGTIMEVDLGALVFNLNYFKSKLNAHTKLMVMVKAFAYGSGSAEVANVLQYHKIDYLGVAYADEGIELRKNNIQLPIMVMNPSVESFHSILQYNLEPEIYSPRILSEFTSFLEGRTWKIHLKIDTGMHRLGFEPEMIDDLILLLDANKNIQVASVFTHLAGSDEADHDAFSKMQAETFLYCANKISAALGYKPIYHALNTPGILRHPQYQFDMVRLGVGLYGVDPTEDKHALKPVATLKTVISQRKEIKAGETIGYGRKGKAIKDMSLATIAIGYADGYNRAFSQGVGEVLVNGKRAKVVGNVCMDMTMIDVTGLSAKEGDEVIIFGEQLPISDVASSIHTIPYEILTNTSERVKRVFVAESI